MDLSSLKMNGNDLLGHMRKQGYSQIMLDEVSKVISFLLSKEGNVWGSYENVLDKYLEPYKNSSGSTRAN